MKIDWPKLCTELRTRFPDVAHVRWIVQFGDLDEDDGIVSFRVTMHLFGQHSYQSARHEIREFFQEGDLLDRLEGIIQEVEHIGSNLEVTVYLNLVDGKVTMESMVEQRVRVMAYHRRLA